MHKFCSVVIFMFFDFPKVTASAPARLGLDRLGHITYIIKLQKGAQTDFLGHVEHVFFQK